MASKREKSVKWPVDRIGFVLDAHANPGSALQYVLVRHKRSPKGTWQVHRADASPSFSRYCNGLLLLATLAIAREDPSPVLICGREGEPFWQVARYFRDIQKQTRLSGSPRKYHAIPAKLRHGIQAIFKATGRTAQPADARIERMPISIRDTISFWDSGSCDAVLLAKHAEQGNLLPFERVSPQIDTPSHLREHLNSMLHASYWTNWARQTATRRRGAKKTLVLDRLRSHLHREATEHLLRLLGPGGPDDWVDLGLREALVPRPGLSDRHRPESSAFIAPGHADGRVRRPLPRAQLWTSRDRYFLTGVSGSGKTTFLRVVQVECLASGKRVPFILQASSLRSASKLSWKRIRQRLMAPLRDLASDTSLRNVLNRLHESGEILLMVDGMDNLNLTQGDVARYACQIVDEMATNSVLLAGRPASAGQADYGHRLRPLHLDLLDTEGRERFFGKDSLDQAKTLLGPNEELLSIPILARLTKALVHGSEARRIANRWELYGEFVARLPEMRSPAGQTLESHKWSIALTQHLGKLAYEAIEHDPPIWLTVPNSFARRTLAGTCDGSPDRSPPMLDDLASSGLVEQYVDARDGHTGIAFAHQSFQEYLAAHWANQSVERVDHVLRESWNPKWREVLRFLAGSQGGRLIDQLYASSDHDSASHARLFLAAELATETTLTTSQERLLVSDLSRLTTCEPFRLEAIRSLVTLNTDKAHETVWDSIDYDPRAPDAWDPDGPSWRMAVPPDALGPMFRQRFLDQLIRDVASYKTLPEGYYAALIAWGEHVSHANIDRMLRWCYEERPCYHLAALARWLDDTHIRMLAEDLLSCRCSVPAFSAEALICAEHIPPDSLTRLIGSLNRPDSPQFMRILSVVNAHSASIPPEALPALREAFWKAVPARGSGLVEKGRDILRRSASAMAEEALDRLDSTDRGVAATAALSLRHCAASGDVGVVDRLRPYMAEEDLRPVIIDAIGAIFDFRDNQTASDLLTYLHDNDTAVRASVLSCIPRMPKVLTEKVIGPIEACLLSSAQRTAESDEPTRFCVHAREARYASMALASLATRLRRSTIRTILSSLDWMERCPPYDEWDLIDSLRNLQGRITASRTDAIVQQICHSKSHPLVCALGVMLSPEKMRPKHIRMLTPLLAGTSGSIRIEIATLLKLIHERTGQG